MVAAILLPNLVDLETKHRTVLSAHQLALLASRIGLVENRAALEDLLRSASGIEGPMGGALSVNFEGRTVVLDFATDRLELDGGEDQPLGKVSRGRHLRWAVALPEAFLPELLLPEDIVQAAD